jgi:hypothetical protein
LLARLDVKLHCRCILPLGLDSQNLVEDITLRMLRRRPQELL